MCGPKMAGTPNLCVYWGIRSFTNDCFHTISANVNARDTEIPSECYYEKSFDLMDPWEGSEDV